LFSVIAVFPVCCFHHSIQISQSKQWAVLSSCFYNRLFCLSCGWGVYVYIIRLQLKHDNSAKLWTFKNNWCDMSFDFIYLLIFICNVTFHQQSIKMSFIFLIVDTLIIDKNKEESSLTGALRWQMNV
jgi:hypothetical protein